MTECPICSADVDVAHDTVKGELLQCVECGSELEVTAISPFSLSRAPEEEEDWGE